MGSRGNGVAAAAQMVGVDSMLVGIPVLPDVYLEVVPDSRGPEEPDDDKRAAYAGSDSLRDGDPPYRWLSSSPRMLAAPQWTLVVKRILDVVVAGLAIVALSPLMVAVAFVIKLTSRGPVFYVQPRVGQGGESFRFVKFRTMTTRADEMKKKLEAENEVDGPIFKIKKDPRTTRVGRVLRKLSIDELPQLFHVMTGHMSLVGFRPPLVGEFDQYGDWERQRVRGKPGITCIWQISGRSDLDFRTWVNMDIEYVEKWSLWLDFKILFLTLPAVVSGRGAY